MKVERMLMQKLNTIADWIIRIVVINIMTIILSIPIITMYPAMSAGYNLFNDYVNKDEVNIFKGYFGYFKKDLWKKIVLGFVFVFAASLGYANVTYYIEYLKQDSDWFYLAGYYVTIVLLLAVFIITLYSFTVIRVYPKAKYMTIYKLSFYLSGKYFLKTILLIISTVLPFLMLLAPLTAVMFVFSGVSLAILMNVLLTTPAVIYLKELGEKNV
ncbi:MAG: DUF624 domain-containing protein [Tenericutes bacterium]|jgi:uncharacterized membrane protein YesL|nr:DUF624 domain-containing protein [Mycoplasmatota bacterium]